MIALFTFLRSGLGGWLVGGAAALVMFFMWQLSSAKVDALTAREYLHIQNAITLKSSIETQQQSIIVTGAIATAQLSQLGDLQNKLSAQQAETSAIEREINELRSTEEKNALEAPYLRGLAAGTRLDRIMQRFTEGGGLQDSNNTSTKPPHDTSRADTDAAEDTDTDGDDAR